MGIPAAKGLPALPGLMRWDRVHEVHGSYLGQRLRGGQPTRSSYSKRTFHSPSHKGTCMTKIGLIAAAAVLAGGIGLAAAQTTGMPSTSSGDNQGKCWDAVTNQVQDNARTSGTTGSTSGGVTGSTSGTNA